MILSPVEMGKGYRKHGWSSQESSQILADYKAHVLPPHIPSEEMDPKHLPLFHVHCEDQ